MTMAQRERFLGRDGGNEKLFSELERIRLPVKSAVLDGECICFDVSIHQIHRRHGGTMQWRGFI